MGQRLVAAWQIQGIFVLGMWWPLQAVVMVVTWALTWDLARYRKGTAVSALNLHSTLHYVLMLPDNISRVILPFAADNALHFSLKSLSDCFIINMSWDTHTYHSYKPTCSSATLHIDQPSKAWRHNAANTKSTKHLYLCTSLSEVGYRPFTESSSSYELLCSLEKGCTPHHQSCRL